MRIIVWVLLSIFIALSAASAQAQTVSCKGLTWDYDLVESPQVDYFHVGCGFTSGTRDASTVYVVAPKKEILFVNNVDNPYNFSPPLVVGTKYFCTVRALSGPGHEIQSPLSNELSFFMPPVGGSCNQPVPTLDAVENLRLIFNP